MERGCLFWPVWLGFLPGRRWLKSVYRKVHSAPNKLDTIFQQQDPKARPQISEPTLMESTAAQAFTPLTLSPIRAPPQVDNSAPAVSPHSAGNTQFTMAFLFFPNSQPPKKFSTPPPISQREVVSYLFYLHLWGIKFNIVTTG